MANCDKVWGPAFIVGLVVGILSSFVVYFGWLSIRSRFFRTQTRVVPVRGLLEFSLEELERATDGFKPSRILGTGGFGSVYKGLLPSDSSIVAVKKVSQESRQGQREFLAEISTIGGLQHENLVTLRGWCQQESTLLLVYDFMKNGSLDQVLFDRTKPVLDWDSRYRIACGVARSLAFLHHDHGIVHRDVKSSNVMLDAGYSARLGDFGLARRARNTDKCSSSSSKSSTTSSVSFCSTSAGGTIGYLAPETYQTGRFTVKSDIYSFGILVLELVTGRKVLALELANEGLSLLEWVWINQEAGHLHAVADPRLRAEFNSDELNRLLTIGLNCCHQEPAVRPSMRAVVDILHTKAPIPRLSCRYQQQQLQWASSFSTSESEGELLEPR